MSEDSRRYLIEILLKAHEEVSKVAAKANEALNKVVAAQKEATAAEQTATTAMREQRDTLQQLHDSHVQEKKDLSDKAKALRDVANASKQNSDAAKRDVQILKEQRAIELGLAEARKKQNADRVAALRQEAAELENVNQKRDASTVMLRREATALEAADKTAASIHEKRAAALSAEIAQSKASASAAENDARVHEAAAKRSENSFNDVSRAASNSARELEKVSKSIDGVGSSSQRTTQQGRGLRGFFTGLKRDSRDADLSLSKLSASLKGFQVAFAIKYAQALLTALVGLGGELIAVASSAIQAGLALGGSLVAGAAQAVPVIGVLAATIGRLAAVLKVVKLANTQQLAGQHDAAAATERQSAAADQIKSAEQGVADAHRGVADAQKAVTLARADAIRQVQDLIAAESAAQRAAEGAALSLEAAQAALRQAIRSGDTGSIAQAELDVRNARADKRSAGVDVTRARQDAAPVRARGVEGTAGLQQAEKALADARRQEARAADQLTQARHGAAHAADQETAANDRLAVMLAALSPAERELYKRIQNLQDIYKKNIRPITDIIIGSFSRVVDRIAAVLQDPKVLGAFTKLAQAMADALDHLTKIGSSPQAIGFFTFMAKEAAKNIPIVTGIFEKLFKVFQNIARAASPALTMLLEFFDSLAGRAEKASGNTDVLTKFFKTGIRYLERWVELGIQIARLFLAVIGASAEQGTKSIKGMTESVKDATKWVQTHQEKMRKFFSDSAEVTGHLWRIVKAIATEMLRAFSPNNVKAFADFLTSVVVPALGNTIVIMGQFTEIAHEFLSLPFVSDLVQWLITVALLSKGFGILSGALKAVGAMLGFVSVEGKLAFVGNPWILGLAAVIAAVVLLDRKFHFLGPTLKWLAGAFTDAFNAVKKVALSIVHWFSDAWTKGIFHWLNLPYILAFKAIKGIFEKINGPISDAFNWVKDFFSSGPGSTIKDILFLPFHLWLIAVKGVFNFAKEVIGIFLDVLAGRFDTIGRRIGRLFTGIFHSMKDAITTILNSIIDAVNLAIKGFNALPFHKDISLIGHIGESSDKSSGPGLFGQVQSNAAEAVNAKGTFYAATGANVQARNGGVPIVVGEGGYDEVVLTTDPRHVERQKQLLGKYLAKMAPHFAVGGWVQGAQPPHGSNSGPILALAKKLFGLGFNATSGGEYRGTGTLHDQQMAVDWGDSVNSMPKLWSILMPMRQRFTELFGPGYLPGAPAYRYGVPGPAVAGHEDHIHVGLGTAINRLGAIFSGLTKGNIGSFADAAQVARVVMPKSLKGSIQHILGRDWSSKMPGLAVNPTHSVYKLAEQAIKSMKDQVNQHQDDTGARVPGLRSFSGGGSSAQNKALAMKMYAAARNRLGGSFSMLDYIIMHESGYRTDATNPNGGAYGIPQSLPASKMASAGSDWRTNPATQLRWMFNYIMERYHGLPQAYAFWQANSSYDNGGLVPGSGAQRAIVHGGEHVWTAGEVAKAGGHSVMFALRQLLGGGGQGIGSYQAGGRIGTTVGEYVGGFSPTTSGGALKRLEQILDQISPQLKHAARISVKFRQAFALLLEDGGILDQLIAQAQKVVDQAAVRLQRREFHVGKRGPHRTAMSDVEIAQANAGALDTQRTVLDKSSEGLNDALRVAREARHEAEKRLHDSKKGSKAYADAHKALLQAETNINSINTRIKDNNKALAQNAQDQVEALESIQQAQLDAINTKAGNKATKLDQMTRVMAALGKSMSPADIATRQIADMQDQFARLQPLLKRARKSGNTDLAKTIKDQMDELQVRVAEASAGLFQDAIDTVNKTASDSLAPIERDMRMAQIGGTNYARLGRDLASKGSTYSKQRYRLSGLLNTATAGGNIDQIKSLTSQIADLDVTIAENSQAIKDNTNAAFADRVSKVNESYSFTSGVLGAASTFFSSIGQMTGNTNLGVLKGLNQTQGAALGTQRTGLLGALGDLLGYKGAEKTGLMGLQGGDLVNTLLTLSQGPVFQGIMDRLDSDAQGHFKELINSLLGNVNATNDNTNALSALTGSTTQAWSSTSWQWYRNAIFTGSGGLLPRYQIPSMDVGGRVLSDGMVYAHAGEVIPASVSRPYRGSGSGDHMEAKIYVTEQVQQANPEVISARLLHRWKTRPKS